MPPQDIFEIAHSETLFPAFLEPVISFPGKAGQSFLKFSLKRTIFNETGQLVGECQQQKFQLFIMFFFFKKDDKVQ